MLSPQSMKVDTVENRKRLEEKYRGRIRELELKMKLASEKAASAARYEKMKGRIEEKCSHLESEIRSMRQQKVALTRAVEASRKEMNAYKRARDKELAQVEPCPPSPSAFPSYLQLPALNAMPNPMGMKRLRMSR